MFVYMYNYDTKYAVVTFSIDSLALLLPLVKPSSYTV